MPPYLFDRICSCCDCGKHGFILPADVGFDNPVNAESQHMQNDKQPKKFSEPCLVREEDVDYPLD